MMNHKEWLIPFVEEYINQRKELRTSIIQTGEILREICESCYTEGGRVFVNNLSDSEKNIAENILNNIQKYKIKSLGFDSYSSSINIKSLNKIREFVSQKNEYEIGIGEWEEIDESGDKVYSYKISIYTKAFKATFLAKLFHLFDNGIDYCSHIKYLHLMKSNKINIMNLLKEKYDYPDPRSLDGTRKPTKKWIKTLLFSCDDCFTELSKRGCSYRVKFNGFIYDTTSCFWENALLLKLLKDSNKEFVHTTNSYTPSVVIKPDNILISFTPKIDKNLINAIKPNIIILNGSQKDMSPLIEFEADILCINDEKILYYDKNQEVDKNIETIINCIINNLESYCDAERGNDHDRYIKAIAKIGKKNGFISQTEYAIKGSRVDCVWIDKTGKIFGAIEVELTGGIKKDIISTWELKPNLSIIINNTKTDNPILNLTEYVILKSMPHPLICINISTKSLFYLEKQNIIMKKKLLTKP